MNQAPYQPAQPQPAAQTTVVQIPQPQIPAEYKPLGAWAFFGWQLLFALPIVGFIMLCVFALGGTSNVNLRNFARSYFCGYLIFGGIALLTFLVLLVITLATGVGLASLIPLDEILRQM